MFTNIRRQNSTFSHEVINPQIYIIQFNLKKKKKDVKILISDFFFNFEFAICFGVYILELLRYCPCTMYVSFIYCLKSENKMYESIMLHKTMYNLPC